MQRDGWLNGDIEPFAMPSGPYDDVLTNLLQAVAGGGTAVLANGWGLTVAHAGCNAQAQRLALAAAALSPLVRTTGHDTTESALAQIVQSVRDRDGEEFAIRPLYLRQVGFYLVMPRRPGGTVEERSVGFVRLMALLARRYLGVCD